MLTHIGRRTGLRRYNVLEVVQYRRQGPEAVVVNGFGRESNWVRNIEANGQEQITVGLQHFSALHRFLDEQEAMQVMRAYEQRHPFIVPPVHGGLGWLLGWIITALMRTATDW